jgi:hypothetical protein
MGARLARAHAIAAATALVVVVAPLAFAQSRPAPPPGAIDPTTGTVLPPLPAPPEPSTLPVESPAPSPRTVSSTPPSTSTSTSPPPVEDDYANAPPLEQDSGSWVSQSTEKSEKGEATGKRERTWYGWQILIADGTAFALVVGGAGSNNGSQTNQGVVDVGVGTYLLGGPIVHFAHGSVGKGFGSLGLRVGLPVGGALGGLILGAIGSSGNSNGISPALEVAGVGFVLGIIAAPILDVTLLAYEYPSARDKAARSAPPRLQLAPVAAVPRDASGRMAPTLGLVGAF